MKGLLTIFMVLISVAYSNAQPYKTIGVFKPYKWMIGVEWTAIDDDGNKFGNLFDVNNSWNYKLYPTRLTVDRYFIYGWSMEFAASYMNYDQGKVINDSTNVSATFLSADINGKYSFYQLYAPKARWIDPYLTFGLGYTYRSAGAFEHTPTVNLGGGVNFWFSKNVGLRLSSNAKFAVYPNIWNTPENYLQHNAGLVLRFGGGNKSNGDFGNKKYKWTREKTRYKAPKGGQ